MEFAPRHLFEDYIVTHHFIFKIYAFAGLTKFFGLHNVFKFSHRWCAIWNALIYGTKLLWPLIKMVLAILYGFGVLGVCFMGGTISTDSPKITKQYGSGVAPPA